MEHFARPYRKGGGVAAWLDSLPGLLAADGLRAAVEAIARRARDNAGRSSGAWAATSSSAASPPS